jgi:hypothetical protein
MVITFAGVRQKTPLLACLFSLYDAHWAAEFWVNSTDGWRAVVDGSSRYAMVERFPCEEHKTYPGRASVIFWTNGPHLKFNSDVRPW